MAEIIELTALVLALATIAWVCKGGGWAHEHRPWRACPGCGLPDDAHEERPGDFKRWASEPTVTPGRQS
jgi:rubrerythrin